MAFMAFFFMAGAASAAAFFMAFFVAAFSAAAFCMAFFVAQGWALGHATTAATSPRTMGAVRAMVHLCGLGN